MKLTKLLIIDAQVDFCSPNGSLYVPGANKDILVISQLIEALKESITEIFVSLDSHTYDSIFFPDWFVDSNGNCPKPFTNITLEDFNDGEWFAEDPSNTEWTAHYLKSLELKKKQHIIWPYHCMVGEFGQTIVEPIGLALTAFSKGNYGDIRYITKGQNQFTEQFSIFGAEVPRNDDPNTLINSDTIDKLETADQILITGEAGSHCVSNSIKDMVHNFKDTKSVEKLVWVENAISPVPGFEELQEQFIKEMISLGMKVKKFENGKLQ